MERQSTAKAFQAARFGRRKVAPRACVVDNKPHIRKFLVEALSELGFVTCGCTEAGELNAALDEYAPDLFVVGLSPEGIDVAAAL
jgi:DNA-binding response OmpR family regulator